MMALVKTISADIREERYAAVASSSVLGSDLDHRSIVLNERADLKQRLVSLEAGPVTKVEDADMAEEEQDFFDGDEGDAEDEMRPASVRRPRKQVRRPSVLKEPKNQAGLSYLQVSHA